MQYQKKQKKFPKDAQFWRQYSSSFLSLKTSQYLLTWGSLQRSGEPALWPGSAGQAYRQDEKTEIIKTNIQKHRHQTVFCADGSRLSNKVHMSNFTLNCLVHGLKQPPELSSEQLPHIVLPAFQWASAPGLVPLVDPSKTRQFKTHLYY